MTIIDIIAAITVGLCGAWLLWREFGKARLGYLEEGTMNRSTYHVSHVDRAKRVVWIIDEGEGRSVTNDAERVCHEVNARYSGFRIIYRDTMGRWDELVHSDGTFRGFKVAPPSVQP